MLDCLQVFWPAIRHRYMFKNPFDTLDVPKANIATTRKAYISDEDAEGAGGTARFSMAVAVRTVTLGWTSHWVRSPAVDLGRRVLGPATVSGSCPEDAPLYRP